MLVAVTDHAAERFRQRVRGTLEAKTEIATRVSEAVAAGRLESGQRGAELVRDLRLPNLTYVCRRDGSELVVVTVWEDGEDPAVPRRFTDVLRSTDRLVADRKRPE
jgi:heme-degrading monooxygenase HmoA